MVKRHWVMAGMAALALAGGAWWLLSAGKRIDPNDPGQVALGQALYRSHCAECHGAALQGEPDWQTRRADGTLPAPPHDASGHTWHHADDQLFAIIKHGMARFAPPDYKSKMPAYVGKLSDAEIRAVLAYIKSSWPAEVRARQDSVNRR